MIPLLSAVAIVLSGLVILMLGVSDPKRRRTLGLSASGRATNRWRRPLALLAVLPGGVLLGMGQGAAFLIWLGGTGVLGWLATLLLSSEIAKTERS